MAEVFGMKMSKRELMKHIGDITQVTGAQKYEISEGKGKGVTVIEVKTGTGFSFTVVPDRGMDIAYASYKGVPISFISKTGITSPFLYEEPGIGFLRSFYAGLLTTCGLTYFGSPCEDNGETLGLHGRATSLLAKDVSIIQQWEEDEYVIKIRGEIRQSRVFGENIALTREIITYLGSNKLVIHDTVENEGYEEQPLMMLYHCNFGFPIVSEDSVLEGDFLTTIPKDNVAESGIKTFSKFQSPTHQYKEQVFFHKLQADSKDIAKVTLYNKKMDLGIYIKYDTKTLPYLIEWKQMGEGDYVVGLEPSTWYPLGRNVARERDELSMISPGERKEFYVEIGMK